MNATERQPAETHHHYCAVCGEIVLIGCNRWHLEPMIIYCREHQPGTPQERRVAA